MVLAKYPDLDILQVPTNTPRTGSDAAAGHLMPLFFAYGAAGEGRGEGACVHKEYLGSLPMAAYEFGRHRATNGGDKLGVEAKL